MKNQREIYQALLDGKTVINKKDSTKIKLSEDGSQNDFVWFKYPQDWGIYDDTFKMKPAEWYINSIGKVYYEKNYDGVMLTQKFGMKYHTKELAERARDEMREGNLLRYWASVIDPTWEANWDDTKQEKWYIDYDTEMKEYILFISKTYKTLGTVYMSEESAIKICEALNNGDLELC